MILELGDGRELILPDEVSDEFARQLKKLILETESRAAAAEADVQKLRDEMAILRKSINQSNVKVASADGTAQAIQELQSGLLSALARIERATSADRQIVPDEFGEYTRSKIVN
jgi:hypothetical protein